MIVKIKQVEGLQTALDARVTGAGSGTVNYITKWSSTTGIVDSQIQDDGTTIGIATAPSSFFKVLIDADSLSTGLRVQNLDSGYAIRAVSNSTNATSANVGIAATSQGATAAVAAAVNIAGQFVGGSTVPADVTTAISETFGAVIRAHESSKSAMALYVDATTNNTADNIGLYVSTANAGAGNNYAIIVPSGGGNVGLGVSVPTTQLHVVGDLRLVNGSQAAGYILETDANGVATWVDPSTALTGTLALNDLTDVTTGLPGTPTAADDGKMLFYDFAAGAWITDDTVRHGTVVINAKKSTAGTIAKGTPVYLVGFDSDLHTVETANASSGATMPVIGLAGETLDATNSKHVITFGKIEGLDTTSTGPLANGETWSINDDLYVDTTTGELTNVRPTGATTQIQRVAKVLRVDGAGGSLFIFNTARTAGLPNLTTDYVWMGNANNQPVETLKTELGIYGGSGTIPSTTAVTVTDTVNFDSNTFVIDGTNNRVGIGTGAPGSRLHVISSTDTYGAYFVGSNHGNATALHWAQGTTKWATYHLNQGTFSGESVASYAVNLATAGTTHIGAQGKAAPGTQYAIGVDGGILNNSTAVTQYIAGVRSLTPNFDNHAAAYGTYSYTYYQDAATIFTNDIVGVLGWGRGSTGNASSTGRVIGGIFRADGSAGTGNRIALLVPNSLNDGVVVLGADDSTGTEMLQVTGATHLNGAFQLSNLTTTPASGYVLQSTDANGNADWVDLNLSQYATTAYVDSVAAGLDPKESVRFTTLDAITGTYNSTGGTGGTGAFTGVDLTNTGDFDLNGNTVAIGDRILIKDQASATQNGIYVVTTAGAAGAIERASDHDGSPAGEVSSGNYTFVELGATYENVGFVLQGDGILTLNTDNLVWVVFTTSGNGIYSGSGTTPASVTNVTLGNTLNFVGSSVTTTISSTGVVGINNVGTGGGYSFRTTSTASGTIGIALFNTGSGSGSIDLRATSDNPQIGIADSTGTTNVMLRSSGDSYFLNDLGIGTATASANLHVNGTIRFDGLTTTPAAGYVLQSTNANGDLDWVSLTSLDSRTTLSGQTTTATPTEIYVDGVATNRIDVATGTTYGFEIVLTAIQTAGTGTGSVWMHKYKGAIKNIGGTTSIVGTVTEETIAEDSGATNWSAAVTADDTNDALTIDVTGEASKTIEWVAKVELTEAS